MHIIINKEKLGDALDLTSSVINKKNVSPILQNILLTARSGELEITATDMEVSVLITLEAEVEEEGQITLMNSLLRDIIRSAKGDKIELNSQPGGNIQIRTPGTPFQAVIHSIQPDDYPMVNQQELENAPSFFIKGFLLRDMLSKNIPFAAKEDIRYTFNSVYFEKENLEFRTVSSDTKRLALARTFIDSGMSDFSLLIPIKTARILKDLLGEKDLEIKIMNKKAGFIYENISLISNQIEGKFPDYKAVIPKETNHSIQIPCSYFSDLVKSMTPFLSGDVQKVLLTFGNGELKVSTDETELGKGENRMEINYREESVEMAFNYKFLQDIFSVIEEEELLIKIWQADKPAIFTGKDNDNFLFVTVPMRK